jgi:hypothetical protein
MYYGNAIKDVEEEMIRINLNYPPNIDPDSAKTKRKSERALFIRELH